jgi:hypothetical protein
MFSLCWRFRVLARMLRKVIGEHNEELRGVLKLF